MKGANPKPQQNFGSLTRGAICVVNDPSGIRRHLGCLKISSRNWQTERENILLRLCRCIAARVQRGQSVSKVAKKFSRKWNGRKFKTDPKRKLRLSASYLTTLYRNWQRDGSAEVFRLNYKGPTARKVPSQFLLEVARRAKAPGVFSFQSVLRGIHADLKRGKKIPGLEKFTRKNIPATLPFGRTAYRWFAGINLSERRSIRASIARATLRLLEINQAIENRAAIQSGKEGC